jgi:2-keto-3-deoxy-L-fuconate dehydrogenase
MDARRVIVTGAGSGIGEATVALLSERGVSVVGFDLAGDDTVRGTSAPLLRADVADPAQVVAGVDRALELLGGLDALVCAAGVTERGNVDETDPVLWDHVFGVNVRAPYLCARATLPHLRAGRSPAIVNVGSQFGVIAASGYVAYCASKAALVHLTRAMAVDHAPEGIRVNVVCPGPVDTPMAQRHIGASADPAAELASMTGRTLTGRFAEPRELAQVIAFLVSDEASVLHGATIMADAGYSIH